MGVKTWQTSRGQFSLSKGFLNVFSSWNIIIIYTFRLSVTYAHTNERNDGVLGLFCAHCLG